MARMNCSRQQALGTLIDVLQAHARTRPDALAYRYLDRPREDGGSSITYGELDLRARRIAAQLLRHAAPDDRVLLFFPPGLDYIAAFLGCLYAGTVAVPLYPPRRGEKLTRITRVVQDCSARCALGPEQDLQRVQALLAAEGDGASPLAFVGVEAAAAAEPMAAAAYARRAGDLAFLQYTSGSTGEPKGVMVTHGNLMANQAAIAEGFDSRDDDICLNWLPLYHDMGLIGTTLHPLYCGYPAHVMSPLAFIQDPLSWLECISRTRATVAGGPDFAYALCAKAAQADPQRAAALDLRSWRLAFNGAEPIRARTMSGFARAFAGVGFSRQACFPCYGLAEATLFVTGNRPGAGVATARVDRLALSEGTLLPADDASAIELVACGHAPSGHAVRIVQDGRALPDGRVGEIWVAGPSVTAGYWGRGDANDAGFRARLHAGPDSGLHFLRTGDLGCLVDNALYVTGRQKDVIILNGRNHYPQDIELAAGTCHPALRPGCTAAFAVDGPEGAKVVVVQEVDARAARALDAAPVVAAVRAAVAAATDVAVDEVVLIQPASIPKTSSGKIRRTETSTRYLRGTLNTVGQAPTEAPAEARSAAPLALLDAALLAALPPAGLAPYLEAVMCKAIAARTGQPPDAVDPDVPLTGLGLNSIALVQLHHALQRELGVVVELEAMFKGQSVRALAQMLASARAQPVPIGAVPDAPAAPAVSVSVPVPPLSHNQQQMWFLHQLDPSAHDYHVPLLVECRPLLDAATLRAAVQAAVARHSILRTHYAAGDAGSVQHVLSAAGAGAEADFACVDATGLDDTALRAGLQQEARRPFDLERGPVLRVRLAQRGDASWLLLCVHHVATDFWSMAQLVEELLLACGGAAVPTPERDHRDWCIAKQAYLRGPAAARDHAYWQRQLAGAAADSGLVALPGAGAAGTPGRVDLTLPAAWLEPARRLAAREGRTLNAVCVAAFQHLLHRMSGRARLRVGSLAADRGDWRFARTLGYFVNPVALTTVAEHSDDFAAFFRRSAQDLADALAHQSYPFPLLVQEFASRQRADQQPLFQALFVSQQAQGGHAMAAFAIRGAQVQADVAGHTVRSIALDPVPPAFELVLTMCETDSGGAHAMLEYGGHVVGRALAQSIADGWAQALRGLEAAAQAPAARPQGSALDGCTSLAQAFQQQVRRSPDRTAVSCRGETLSYQALDARAQALARVLMARRPTGDSAPVAVLLERGIDTVVAILAVLKAGAAYLPLDPHSPPERLRVILEDAAPRLLVSSAGFGSLLEQAGVAAGTQVLHVDEALREGAGLPPLDALPCGRDERAYVIFTSGSTGRPKGVQVTHGNVLRLFSTSESRFAFSDQDVWTLFHSFAFDFSVWEMWGALLYGGRLVVVPYETSRSPADFHTLLRQEGVTVLNQTPSAFGHLASADAAQAAPLPSLRLVVFGGEALVFSQLAGWFGRYGDQRPQLVNMYGITETTVHVTWRPVSLADLNADASLIGEPLPDLCIELLDERGLRVADGAIGEIHVGGPGVSLGYLGRPDLTAERFVELELDAGTRRRYYRSGDLARRTPEGDLEFHGRADQQISLNGFRIEPREIEASLARFGGIRQAVVALRSAAPGGSALVATIAREPGSLTDIRQLLRTPPSADAAAAAPRLAAYVVCDALPDAQALHEHLARHLPEYMVPSEIHPVSSVPVNHNGKVDLRALEEATRDRLPLRACHVAPRNDTERLLAGLFAEVLGHPLVGVHDGFFQLGGDSIRIIQLRSRALKAGLALSVQDIFRLQTPAALAAVCGAGHATDERPRVAAFAQLNAEERARLPQGLVDAYPLARLQEGLLFHSLFGDDVAMYCDIFEFRLQVPFDEAAFRAAAQALVDRHPIFRTSFHFAEFERPLQCVHAQADAIVEVHDHRGLTAQAQVSRYQAWLEDEKRRTYDITTAPLLRFSLHRMDDDTFVFTMSFHDALLDGWSESSTVAELLGHYFREIGHPVPAAAAVAQTRFADFVALEQESLADPQTRAFWTQELEDLRPTMLPEWVPAAHRGAAQMRFHAVDLPAGLSEQLHATAKRLGVSVKHVLLAAHAAVMAYVCGESDVVLAVESNGRLEDGDGERVLGTHLNVVPWRMQLEAQSWDALVREMKAKETGLQPHRRYPYQAIQALKGNAPLFDTSFNYTHFHVYQDLAQLPGLRILDAKAYIHTHFALRVEFNQDPFTRHLMLDLEADVQRVPVERLRAIGGYFVRALEAIVEQPAQPHGSACLMAPDELAAALEAAAGPVTFSAENPPVLYMARFEQAAREHAERVAAVDRRRSVRYLELAREARRAATALRRLGVSRGAVIGLACERSIEMLTAMLGAWQVGASFVPLPEGPVERVDRILALAGATHVLHGRSHQALERALACKATRLPLEALSSGETDAHDPVALGADELAYMIFTSGSTGEPKGVMIEHGGMVNHMDAKIEDLAIGPRDKVSQDAAATFDICIWQFCAPLLAGAQVRIFEDDIAKDPARLLDHVVGEAVSILEVSPSVLSTMLVVHTAQAGTRQGLLSGSALRWVVSSGEALQPSLVHQLRQAHPQVHILNMWGATETSDDCTHHAVPFDLPADAAKVSIGRPIRNAAVHVLDTWRRVVPLGTPGELFVAGPCVGRGYANDPERTAAAFGAAPWVFATSDRLYRSGDRGWRATDGQLYFIGRRDHQVKIRGHRIEIGEVEAVLDRLAEVQEAAVMAVPDADGQLALAAWIVPSDGAALTGDAARAAWTTQLRRRLMQALPPYMVPDTLALLHELPRNTNGKVDRKALQLPEAPEPSAQTALREPQDALEAEVLEIFRQVLRRARLGTDTGFFEAGGNSLLATQVVSRARRRFGIELPIRALFENDSVVAFCRAVRAASGTAGGGRIARADPRPARVPLSFNQERLWFLDRFEGADRAYGCHFALAIEGPLDTDALARALQMVVDRHEALRTRFVAEEGQAWQCVEPQMPLELQRHDLSPVEPARRQAALADAMQAALAEPFRLDQLPLARATLFQLSAQHHVLLWRNHHIVGDGWSAGVLMREIEQIYPALRRGEAPALPALPIQFADYALWQRGQVGSAAFSRRQDFWTRYLASQDGVLQLPTDFERPLRQSFTGRRIAVAMPGRLVERARALCTRTGSTLYGFLQCALGLLLSRYCKQSDLLLGTVVANRQHLETEQLVGFLTQTLPVRHRFDPAQGFAAHLQRLHGDLLEVFEHQDIPFEHLVQLVVQGRRPDISPLVQAMFVLQNEDLTPPRIDGLAVSTLETDRGAAILDLLFDLRESGDGVQGEVEFNVQLFEEATVRGLWQHLLHLIDAVLQAPDTPLARISALGAEEQRTLDALWRSLHPGDIGFWNERAPHTPQWEAYLEHAEERGVLLSAYLAVSEYA